MKIYKVNFKATPQIHYLKRGDIWLENEAYDPQKYPENMLTPFRLPDEITPAMLERIIGRDDCGETACTTRGRQYRADGNILTVAFGGNT